MFKINQKNKIENKKLYLPNIHTRVLVDKKEDYFKYINELKNSEINSIHFIKKENTRNFISNPDTNNINITRGYEYLYLKSEITFQEILFKYLKIKNINNYILRSFIIFFTEQMYRIIEVKYYNNENINFKEVINIHLNHIEEIENYNKFMKEKIKDSEKLHISKLYYELCFKEILEDLKREIINIDHGLINFKNILNCKSIDIYETDFDYNEILSSVFLKENIKALFLDIKYNKKEEIQNKYLIYDYIPNDIFETPSSYAQLLCLGISIIYPYMKKQEITQELMINTKEYKLK